METRESLLAKAEEAERLAALVSYRLDKERLLAQAKDLRDLAEALPPPEPAT